MARRPSPYRIKMHGVYTPAEAAEALGLHRKTVTRWIRNDGLKAATDSKPWLLRGSDLKAWLTARREKGRTRLQPGQIFCLPCRAAKRPAAGMADYRPRTQSAGMLIGLCPDCERLMHRAMHRTDLERIAADLDVTIT